MSLGIPESLWRMSAARFPQAVFAGAVTAVIIFVLGGRGPPPPPCVTLQSWELPELPTQRLRVPAQST